MRRGRINVDQARLRPHLRDAKPGRQVPQDEFERAPGDTSGPRWKVPVGDDRERLRGLPAIGPSASVMPGTDPVQALLSKERRAGR